MNPAREEARPSQNGGRRRPRQYEAPVRNHTGKDDAVYDPFVGSGTAIIAAERFRREPTVPTDTSSASATCSSGTIW
jgi:hypothetical protein